MITPPPPPSEDGDRFGAGKHFGSESPALDILNEPYAGYHIDTHTLAQVKPRPESLKTFVQDQT